MFDTKKLSKAFRDYDVEQITAAVGPHGLKNAESGRKFVSELRRSSCLVIQIEDSTKEHSRNYLVDKCRDMLAECPDIYVNRDFDNHVADAKIVEYGFREIFRMTYSSEVWKHSPAEQMWGTILLAERELNLLRSEIANHFANLATKDEAFLDFRQPTIEAGDGSLIQPDIIVNSIVKNVGDTLITLAYKHKWFEKETHIIVFPNEVAVTEDTACKAGTFFLAASLWRSLQHAWDSSRLHEVRFRVREQEFPVNNGGTRTCNVIEASSAEDLELKDRIALQRLNQVFFRHQKDLEGQDIHKVAPSRDISLSKDNYLSSAERIAVEVMDGHFHLPIDDGSVIIGGLTLRAWIRGYACYEQLAHSEAGEPIFSCLRFSEEELKDALISVGLSQDQAKVFIQLTTFSRGVADLFDAPLLKVSDGSYRFFTTAYHTPVLGVIVLSRISWFNRRRNEHGNPANDSVFESKGKIFEKRVLELFREVGVSAHSLKYKVDGVEFDCDTAVLIEDTLFVFECKNRSLPMGHYPSLHYFTLALKEAQEQVKRIVRQFSERPDIVRTQFGKDAEWSRIVPVVLHALPWSSGYSDGVYIYDASALSKFLREGFIRINAECKLGDHRVLRRHRYQLRRGAMPTAKELEREMENPAQMNLHALGWEQSAHLVQVSHDVVFHLPQWSQRTATLEEQMLALGSSPEEAAQRAKEIQDFPSAVQKHWNGLNI